jgi:hypothetical protein
MAATTPMEAAASLAKIRSHWDGMRAAGLSVEATSAAMTEMMDAIRAGDLAEANRIGRDAMGPEGLKVAEARLAEFKALAIEAFA